MKRKKEELIFNHDSFVHIVENTNDFIYYAQVYPEVKFKYLSPSAENFFGKGSIAGALVSADVAFKDIHPDDYPILIKKIKGELDYSSGIIQRWKDSEGRYRWFEEYATPVFENGKLAALQGVLRNIDDKMELQAILEYRMNHDSLTDLFNRGFFETQMRKYDEEINSPAGLIICDLNELKTVNDLYGHKEGDLLIRSSADILKEFSRSGQIIAARIGGDEFALLIADKSLEEVKSLAESLHKRFNNCFIESISRNIKMAIGYAYSNSSINKMDSLFIEADKMMYQDKKQKKILGC
ncbi:diguanylate cyclase domain-containing protein [Actinomycetes bacterium NPDC127524]